MSSGGSSIQSDQGRSSPDRRHNTRSGAMPTIDPASSTPGGRDARLPRVLVVIKCLGYGGAERLLVDTLAAGDKQSFHYEAAYVLASQHALVPAVEASGTRVHALGAQGNWDFRWMARLRRLISHGQFDVVHFHLPFTASLGRLVVASLPAGTRPATVYTEHSVWDKMAVLVRGLNRATIGLDQALIVVSDAAHDALPRALKPRARVIVHGVDLSQARALVAQRDEIRRQVRDELGVPEGTVLVLAVANLRSEKGYDVLLDAARLIADRDLPIRFAAVGSGPLETELHQRHTHLDLGDRFAFLGRRDDVFRLLTGSDIFVLPSHQEGLPVSLMEATSVGIAVVATAVGGVPQVITDGVEGLVVPRADAPALAGALERVAGDPELRARLGAGATAKSAMFDVTSASRKVEDIYRQLIEARR